MANKQNRTVCFFAKRLQRKVNFMKSKNEALLAEYEHKSAVENSTEYIENFDILETINNVGNDEVFTPVKVCTEMLDILPEEVWHNPNYKWLNPCSKNGVFEREIALRLDEGLKEIIPDTETRRKHILQNMIFSIGLTRFTSHVARRTLYYCSDASRKCDGIKADDGHYVNGYAIGNGAWFDTPEGNILTPNAEHQFGKDGKCVFCGIRNSSTYVDPLQREQYAYQFIHYKHAYQLEHFLQDRFFNGDRNMKFDIIVGNPPYQLTVNDSGKGLGAVPIYHKFINQSLALKPKYLCMVIPARWYSGGVGLDEFRSGMLNDRHIRRMVDYTNANDCFPNDINGGVCYFLWDAEYEGDCNYSSISYGIANSALRKLNEFSIFIRNNDAISIVHKVLEKTKKFLSAPGGCSSQTPFGLLSTYKGYESQNAVNDVKILTSKGWRWCPLKDVSKGHELIGKYKTLISKLTCEHAGTPDREGKYRVLSRMEILKPNEICSQSYLTVCSSDDEETAKNVYAYLRTKFARFLLQQSLSGMNISIANFSFVPWLDFSQLYTDDQLFAMYDFSTQEISYINNMIRDME